MEQLPAYLKALYINILKTTNDIEEVLKCQENKNAEFVKKLVNVSQRTKLAPKLDVYRKSIYSSI